MPKHISNLSELKGISSKTKVKVFRRGMILTMAAKEAREYLRELN